VKRLVSIAALFAWMLIPGLGHAQEQAPALDGPQRILRDDLLDHMVGDWRLNGSGMGETVEHQVHVDWVLNHQFLRIHEKAVTPSKAGMLYEAMAMVGYDNTSERYVAHWIDVFGGRWSETLGYGRRDGNTIEFLFEYPDGPFRTTFRWEPESKSWRWRMRQKDKSGVWTDFANLTLIPEEKH
jgi:hypothetical protein